MQIIEVHRAPPVPRRPRVPALIGCTRIAALAPDYLARVAAGEC